MDFKQLRATVMGIAFFSLFAFYSTAQENKPLTQMVQETMELRRQNNYWKGLSPFRNYIKDSAQAVINAFAPFVQDSLENVRSLAYTAIAVSGQKSSTLAVRQQAVSLLTKGCRDKEASMRKNIAGQLQKFLKNDFTGESIQQLTSLLKLEETYFSNTVKLLGFLDLTDQIPVLKTMIDSGLVKNRTVLWDVHLALARLGVQDEINYCVDFVRKTGLNDKVVYNLFPDLVYTRSAEATDYIIEILNSDSKDCFSPNPDNPAKITCAYRAMEYLAPIIKDFPLKTDKDGELEVDNYQEALQVCRRWFQQHTSDYQIDKTRF